jgi:hypothetical protein
VLKETVMTNPNVQGWHPAIACYIMIATLSSHCVPMFGLKV